MSSLIALLLSCQLTHTFHNSLSRPIQQRGASTAEALTSRHSSLGFLSPTGLSHFPVAHSSLNYRPSLATPTYCLAQQTVLQRDVADAATQVFKRSMLDQLSHQFVGDFDNWSQVVADRELGMSPREGGGHEHIHCHLESVTVKGGVSALYAKYYFNANPQKVFRDRLYTLIHELDPVHGERVRMQIHRLSDRTAGELRAHSFDTSKVSWDEAEVTEAIPHCDVHWTRRGDTFEGHMETDEVTVFSPEMKMNIVIRDEITLMENELWVNDRGYTESGKFLYGNYFGVPYKMERVTDQNGLTWTLGRNTQALGGHMAF